MNILISAMTVNHPDFHTIPHHAKYTRFESVNVLFKAYVIEMIALVLPRNRIFMKSIQIENNHTRKNKPLDYGGI